MIRRKSRKTKTTIMLCKAEEVGQFPDDGKWVTICEDHGGIVHHNTKKLAIDWLPHPDEWCPTCQEK